MPSYFARSSLARRSLVVASVFGGACASMACGLSLSGTLASDGEAGVGSGFDASDGIDGATSADGGSSSNDGASVDVTTGTDAMTIPDVASEPPPHVCTPFDSGVTGPLALSMFSLKGDSSLNENNDGKITLTNSNNNEHGAAWWPTPVPMLGGYDLTWTFRVGPGDTAGDGLAFAVLQASGVPDIGDDGNGLGLRNIKDGDGGMTTGYAVIVDMYKDGSDQTDLDKTTLRVMAMPSFTYVAGVAVPVSINDGNNYAVDVSWRAPSTLTATLHWPNNIPYTVTTSDPRLVTAPHSFMGFTASTGSAADSHNELASGSVTMTCN